MHEKQPCTACGVAILPSTAQRTGGLCVPCSTGDRERWKREAEVRKNQEPLEFASRAEIEALQPFVSEFWSRVLGTSYATSFVSDESTLASWEHYLGGEQQVIAKVRAVYGIDIAPIYHEPVAVVVRRVRDAAV